MAALPARFTWQTQASREGGRVTALSLFTDLLPVPRPQPLCHFLLSFSLILFCLDFSHALVTLCSYGVLALLLSATDGWQVALVSCHVVTCVATPLSHHHWDGPGRALTHGAGVSKQSQPGDMEGS